MRARKRKLDTAQSNDGILDDIDIVEGTQVNPKPSRHKVHTLARAWTHIWNLHNKDDDNQPATTG